METNRTNILALVVKFIVTTLAAWIAFDLFDNNPMSWIFLIGVLATILNYLLGDLMILPKSGNITATIADGILAVLLVLLIDWLSEDFDTYFTPIIVFAIITMIFEYIFHRYLRSDHR